LTHENSIAEPKNMLVIKTSIIISWLSNQMQLLTPLNKATYLALLITAVILTLRHRSGLLMEICELDSLSVKALKLAKSLLSTTNFSAMVKRHSVVIVILPIVAVGLERTLKKQIKIKRNEKKEIVKKGGKATCSGRHIFCI